MGVGRNEGQERMHIGWTRWIQKETLRRKTGNLEGGGIRVGLTRVEKIMVFDGGMI